MRGEDCAPPPIIGHVPSVAHTETDVPQGRESFPAPIPPNESTACEEKQRQNDQEAPGHHC